MEDNIAHFLAQRVLSDRLSLVTPLFQTGQALHRRPHVGAGAQLQLRDPRGVHQRAWGGGPDQVKEITPKKCFFKH